MQDGSILSSCPDVLQTSALLIVPLWINPGLTCTSDAAETNCGLWRLLTADRVFQCLLPTPLAAGRRSVTPKQCEVDAVWAVWGTACVLLHGRRPATPLSQNPIIVFGWFGPSRVCVVLFW
ncbi:unnamed protein product [Calypogeia fissa]